MKNSMWILMMLVLACGGRTEDTLNPDEAPLTPLVPTDATSWDGSSLHGATGANGLPEIAPLPTEYRGHGQPWLVASEDLPGGQHLDIIAIQEPRETPDEAISETTYLMRYRGLIGVADPRAVLQASNPVPLTMAETYLGLTGKTPPNELLTHQVRQAIELGRPTTFITPAFDTGLVEEKAFLVECGNGSTLHPDIAGHQYAAPQGSTNVEFCPGTTQTSCADASTTITKFFCSGFDHVVNAAAGLPQETSCTHTAGWIHVGFCPVHPRLTPGIIFTAQEFFGPSNAGAWTAFGAFGVPENTFQIDDWDGTVKRAIAQVFSRTQTTNVAAPFAISSQVVAR